MKAFFLRAKPALIDRMSEFEDQSLIALGSSATRSLDGQKLDGIRSALQIVHPNWASTELRNVVSALNIFVNEMGKDDFVLVPNPQNTDIIRVGRIIGDYYFNDALFKKGEDWCHQRRVEWLMTVSREKLSTDFKQRCKSPRTLVTLFDFVEDIQSLLISKADAIESESTMAASFPLRPDFTIDISVPINISQNEAKRLSAFILTLPLNS